MRTFWILWRRELAGYFLAPTSYLIAVYLLLVMGFNFATLSVRLAAGPTTLLDAHRLFGAYFFFSLALLVVVAPILAMRLLAEERRSGTYETLMTAPVREVEVVLAKYAGALVFLIALWAPTALYGPLLAALNPGGPPLDPGAAAAGGLGLLLPGALFLAIGLLASALTRSAMVAANLAFAANALIFAAGFAPYLSRQETVQRLGAYASVVQHALDFSRGVVDTRPVAFYLINTAWLLFATVKVLEARRWKG